MIILAKENIDVYLILYELSLYVITFMRCGICKEYAIVDEIRDQVRHIFLITDVRAYEWMVDGSYGVSVLYLSCMRTANAIC